MTFLFEFIFSLINPGPNNNLQKKNINNEFPSTANFHDGMYSVNLSKKCFQILKCEVAVYKFIN